MKPHSSISSSEPDNARWRNYSIKYLVFFLVFLAIYLAAGASVNIIASRYDARNESQRVTEYQMADFYALPSNSIDVLILGSSHAMCTFDPYRIKSELGLSAYNLGTMLQQPDTGYFLLKEVLKTQKPKYLVMDLYFKVLQSGKSEDQSLTILKELHPSKNKLNFFFENIDTDAKASYLSGWFNPFGRLYSVLNDRESGNRVTGRTKYYQGRGFFVTDKVVSPKDLTIEKNPFSKEYVPFNTRQIEYFKKIAGLAHDNNIKLICVTAPIPPSILKHIDYYDRVSEETDALANSIGAQYIDFNLAMKAGLFTLSDSDFADQGHLNQVGVRKFSVYWLGLSHKLLSR